MKISIVYASAGWGHQTAAESIYNCLKNNYPAAEVKILDILAYTEPGFSRFYSKGYHFVATHLGFLWAFLFSINNNRLIRHIFNFISRTHSKKFIDYLLFEKPDIVIVTHFFPADVVSFLKEREQLSSRLVTVITDFGVHPHWITANCDDYIVASSLTEHKLMDLGIDKWKIRVFGIPIRPEFSLKRQSQSHALSALLITGSFGFSFIEGMVEELSKQIKLTVVCGNNRELFERLKLKDNNSLKLYGFTDQIPQIMSEVDFIITKPGGLSTAEALAMDLPIIFIKGIPGQETENEKILKIYGCAVSAKNIKEIKNIAAEWYDNPEKLKLFRENISKVKKPGSTKELCEYVCSGSAGASC